MAEYVSKVVLGTGEVLVDLTADTVAADKLLSGITAHGAMPLRSHRTGE